MVNLDKWERVERFSEIRSGDLIRTIRDLEDGAHADVRGTVVVQKTLNYCEGWYTEKNWRIVDEKVFRPRREETATIYRRLPEPFDFPKNVGAVVQAQYKDGPAITKLIFDGLRWVRANGGTSSTESCIRNSFKNFKTLSEGVSK